MTGELIARTITGLISLAFLVIIAKVMFGKNALVSRSTAIMIVAVSLAVMAGMVAYAYFSQ